MQNLLTKVRSEKISRLDFDKRIDMLEMRVNGDLLSTVQKSEQ